MWAGRGSGFGFAWIAGRIIAMTRRQKKMSWNERKFDKINWCNLSMKETFMNMFKNRKNFNKIVSSCVVTCQKVKKA